jgi:hypothetical protein
MMGRLALVLLVAGLLFLAYTNRTIQRRPVPMHARLLESSPISLPTLPA